VVLPPRLLLEDLHNREAFKRAGRLKFSHAEGLNGKLFGSYLKDVIMLEQNCLVPALFIPCLTFEYNVMAHCTSARGLIRLN